MMAGDLISLEEGDDPFRPRLWGDPPPGAAILPPALAARDEQRNLTDTNVAVLQKEISRQTDPASREVLTQELDRIQAKRANGGLISLEEGDMPAPRSERDIQIGGVKAATRNVVRSTADFADMFLQGPHMLLSSMGEYNARGKALARGKTREEAEAAGAAERTAIMSKAPVIFRHLTDSVIAKLSPDDEPPDPSAVEAGMEVVLHGIKQGGGWVDKKTGGIISGADFESMVNDAMAAGMTKGAVSGTRALGPEGKTNVTSKTVEAVQRKLERAAAERPFSPAEPSPETVAARDTVDAYKKEILGLVDENGTPLKATDPATTGEGKWTTPDAAKAAVLGGTGAALVAAYPASDEDKTNLATILAGGLVLSGKGGDFALKPEASSLAVMLEGSHTTLKTLERPEFQNRSVFPKQMLEEALKRPDVPKAEREVLQQVLQAKEGPAISAKELVLGVKTATGDFELGVRESSQYAEYGLGNILPDTSELVAPSNTRSTLYTLPDHMQLGTKNHFSARNLFGWTRSFDEGGVRHVVEIQSDLVQNAKEITPEVREQLTTNLARYERDSSVIRSFQSPSAPSPEGLRQEAQALLQKLSPEGQAGLERLFQMEGFTRGEGGTYRRNAVFADLSEFLSGGGSMSDFAIQLQNLTRDLQVRAAEAKIKLGAAVKFDPIKPMFKDWPKRLVREELAEAARARLARDNTPQFNWPGREPPPRVVRFATADTVAKVEGWGESVLWSRLKDAEREAKKSARELEDLEHIKKTRDPENHPYYRALKTADPSAYASFLGGINIEIASARRLLSYSETELRNIQSLTEGEPPKFVPEHQSIYNRYRDVEKFLKGLGGVPHTDPAGNTWIEVPSTPKGQTSSRVAMFGGAEPEFLARLAGIGIPAALGAYLADNDAQGAVVGAVLGGLGQLAIAKSRVVREAAVENLRLLDRGLGAISTRLRNISPVLARRQLDFEFFSSQRGHQALEAAHEFIKELKGLKGPSAEKMKQALLSGDAETIKQLTNTTRPFQKSWEDVQGLLHKTAIELRDYGLLPALRENYFPRLVKDVDGLLATLDKEQRTALEKILDRAKGRVRKAGGQELGSILESEIINAYLKSDVVGEPKPGFLKVRTVRKIDDRLSKYYAPPNESLVTYLRAATREIEKAKYFGKNLKVRHEGKNSSIDVEKSVGELVKELLEKKELKPDDVEQVKSILNSRFGPGEGAGHPMMRGFKNITYAGLLGNPISAVAQIADLPIQVALRGVAPVLEGIARTLTGKKRIDIREMGLIDHISEEFAGEGFTNKLTKNVMKIGLFTKLDKFTKDVAVNAAYAELTRKSKTAAGRKAIERRYGEAYKEDLPKLIEDLQGGKKTDLVQATLFSELSRTQPVSRLEMPQAYLDNPNGRVLWMLKSFALKQVDLVRREAYNEIKQGQVRRGLRNLAVLSLAFIVSGASQQWITSFLSGRPIDPKWGDIPAGLFQVMGLQSFLAEKVREGKPIEAAGNLILPPTRMLNDLITGDPRSVRYIPGVGRLYYEHAMGGKERYKANLLKQLRKEERLRGMTPEELRGYRERQRERARAKQQRQAETYDNTYGRP